MKFAESQNFVQVYQWKLKWRLVQVKMPDKEPSTFDRFFTHKCKIYIEKNVKKNTHDAKTKLSSWYYTYI